jgi:hypothetical protein
MARPGPHRSRLRKARGADRPRLPPDHVGGISVADRGSSTAALRTCAALATVVLLLGGCGGGSVTGGGLLAVEQTGFRVPLPDGWHAETTNDAAGQLRVVAFLSNVPLGLDCTGAGSARHCSHPTALAEGSLVAWWFAASCAGVDCTPPAGEPLLVGGREASRISGSAICDDLDATSDATYVVAVSPQRLEAIMVCGRNAPASALDELADILEHVEWRTP